jgi:hypothetical protein
MKCICDETWAKRGVCEECLARVVVARTFGELLSIPGFRRTASMLLSLVRPGAQRGPDGP